MRKSFRILAMAVALLACAPAIGQTLSGTGGISSLTGDCTGTGPGATAVNCAGPTHLSGTAPSLTAGNVTTNANLTGPITSTGNATAVAAQTGTGSTIVMQASPVLTTPNIGTPSAAVMTNASGTAASLTAGHVTTNANLTGDVTSVGNASTLANIPAISGANLTTLNGTNISSGTVASARGGTGVSNAGTLTYSGSVTLGTAAAQNTGTSSGLCPVTSSCTFSGVTTTFNNSNGNAVAFSGYNNSANIILSNLNGNYSQIYTPNGGLQLETGGTTASVYWAAYSTGMAFPGSGLVGLTPQGTIPTVSGTGSPTIAAGSTDTAGEVTGGSLATSIVITFSAAKTNAPFCTVTSQSSVASFGYTISTTAITISLAATSSEKVDYLCMQH